MGHDELRLGIDYVIIKGLRFCYSLLSHARRNGHSLTSSDNALLIDFYNLALAVEFLEGARHFVNQQYFTQVWITERLMFVRKHMIPIVTAENAYVGAATLDPSFADRDDVLRLEARFEAVMDRLLHWFHTQASLPHINGQLISNFNPYGHAYTGSHENWLERIRHALTSPLHALATPGFSNFQAGHTRYRIKPLQQVNKDYDKKVIALLPLITGSQDSYMHSESLHQVTRVLVQHHITLTALLIQCAVDAPWKGQQTPGYIQLNEHSGGHERNVLIFKCAACVITKADWLWYSILYEEQQGHVADYWRQNSKAKLQAMLREMTNLAVITQLDAARESLRHGNIVDRVKYW